MMIIQESKHKISLPDDKDGHSYVGLLHFFFRSVTHVTKLLTYSSVIINDL